MRARRCWLLVVVLTGAGCDEPPLTLGITIPEHDVYFPINPAVAVPPPHAMGRPAQTGEVIDCAGCHDGRDSFNEPLCFACHSFDARSLTSEHNGVAGFQAVDSACLACHPDGTIGSSQGAGEHSDLWFPIAGDDVHGDDGYIARVPPELEEPKTCNACHQADRTAQNKCVLCHTTDRGSLAGLHDTLRDSFLLANPAFAANPADASLLDDASCKACHAEIPLNPIGGRTATHDTNIFDSRHHEAECRDCHEVNLPDPKEWAIDFKTATCTCCHASAACTVANQGVCRDEGDVRCH